jgi:hypothetical protein
VRNTYHLSKRLPEGTKSKRLPEGTKYVVESAGQFVRRFVELPNGRKIPLSTRKARPCAWGERISIVPEQAADATESLA